MEKEISIQELSNQMIDNCVAWNSLKKRLCKEIKNCLLPSSVSPIDESLDVAVMDMRSAHEGAGKELLLRVTLLDRTDKIPFSHLEQLNQMFANGLTDIELQPSEGIMAHHPSYNIAFSLFLRSASESIDVPSGEKANEVVQSGQQNEAE